MAKQIHLFATRSDLEPGLRAIEARRPLRYAVCGLFEVLPVPSYDSLLDVPHLGINTRGDHMLGDCYLVTSKSREVRIQKVPQRKGGIRYSVDQRLNPDSTTFRPGGQHPTGSLIAGHIGTISGSPESLELHRDFAKSVTRGFQRVGNYLVGPEALKLGQSGIRLVTMGLDEPVEYDLKEPSG